MYNEYTKKEKKMVEKMPPMLQFFSQMTDKRPMMEKKKEIDFFTPIPK